MDPPHEAGDDMCARYLNFLFPREGGDPVIIRTLRCRLWAPAYAGEEKVSAYSPSNRSTSSRITAHAGAVGSISSK
jgi:hypothetical protein